MCIDENPASAPGFLFLGFAVRGLPPRKEQTGHPWPASSQELRILRMSLRHFLNTQDWTRPELDALLERAAAFKRERSGRDLAGK